MIDNGIDGARAETIRAGLLGIAEEMRTTLVRTAFSPVIYEVLDFGISIYDARCRLIAEAPGLTRFLGANDYAVPILAERIGPKNMAEGDVVVSNYPYWNAAHSYDATMMAPVFADGQEGPAGYLCVRAHWIDLGAKDPGYVIDSTDMHQEGLILPGLKLVKGGVPDAELFELIAFNSRLPETLLGDIRAQLAALATGRNRFRALVLRHGMAAIDAAVERTIAHGRAVARSALARLPEGRWEAEDWLDGDGLTETPVRMHVVVSHADGKLEMDFSGSAPATRGPVNLPFGSTLATAKVAFKALTSPFAATNAGHMEPLEVRATPGTLFHAVYPAPTFTQWTGIVALELIFKALAQGMPDRLPASSGGDVPGFMMIGTHPDTGRPFALSSNEGVGWGGTPRHDGRWAGSHPSQSIVRNTPVEVLESRTGMRIERLELRAGGYGAGARRGGPGLRRDIRFTSPGEFLTIAKKTKSPPWSVAGGAEAAPTRLTLNPGTASERRLGTSRTAVAPGDTVRIETAGGAGHGPEDERPTALRVADLADGFAAPGKTRGDAA